MIINDRVLFHLSVLALSSWEIQSLSPHNGNQSRPYDLIADVTSVHQVCFLA